jgi:RNA polymerase sigma-70 factor, ECF subfamily
MPSPGLARPAHQQESDRALLDLARTGDVAAYGQLVARYQTRIYRLALHLLHSQADAEDAAQEAFVRAYGALHRFDGRSEPFTWIYRIAINVSLNMLRSRRVRRHVVPEEDPRILSVLVETRPGLCDPAAQSADHQMALLLAQGMDTLSELLRTTLVLVCVDGLSHAEAAAVLGCPEGTVAWRVHEARSKLKEFFVDHGVSREEMG